ncbi:MAG: carbon-nitrogen hydrolase family protein [Kiritimatiellae bacterium]|nr:carbon-nitrogen hydrolase family protein [Kiritimatiellia bacterium]
MSTVAIETAVESASTVFECGFEAGETPDGPPLGWELWCPTERMRPALRTDAALTYEGRPTVCCSGAGNANAMGLIRRRIPGLKPGVFYRFSAWFKPERIPNVNNTVWPLVSWRNDKVRKLLPVEQLPGGWVRAELVADFPAEMEHVQFELFAGWIPDGAVRWGKVRVEELPGYGIPERLVTIGVLDEKPPRGTLTDNGRFYVAAIEKLCAAEQPDAICLPEHFNTTNVEPKPNPFGAVTADSDYIVELKAVAARCNVNLIGSIVEDDAGAIFNTGIVINREGALIAKYHKTHMPLTEVIRAGRSRGNEIEVIETDFGRIGILICWDYQFPDPIRHLALRGAEVVFVPIAGEGRISFEDEQGRRVAKGMEYAGSAAAVDNGLVMVFSATQSGVESWSESMIIDQAGKIRDRSGLYEGRRHVLSATVDLAARYSHPCGESFREKYWTERRPELYDGIVDTRLRMWK